VQAEGDELRGPEIALAVRDALTRLERRGVPSRRERLFPLAQDHERDAHGRLVFGGSGGKGGTQGLSRLDGADRGAAGTVEQDQAGGPLAAVPLRIHGEQRP